MFCLGQILATPGALNALQHAGESPEAFVSRHRTGDWGDLSLDDAALNDAAVMDGSRILSAYHTQNGTKLWVITEAADDAGRREATTILLPDEY